ncbi:MAG: hypothetical protein EOO75_01020, partial [Myxococcales bacterium]
MPLDPLSLAVLGSGVAWLVSRAVQRHQAPGQAPDELPEDLHAWKRQDIADFRAPGDGKISGRVRLHGRRQLRAPLSGEPCVAYTLRCLLHRQDYAVSRKPPETHLELDDFRAVSFVVEDTSGRAVV